MPYAGRWFFAEVLRGIEEALRLAGYDLVLHVLADTERRRDFFAELPVRRRVDALLIVALPLDPDEVALLRTVGVPMVSVAEPVAGLRGERIDNVHAARLAVEHLIALGHHRIATIGEPPSDFPSFTVPGLRMQGFKDALAAGGVQLRPEWVRDGQYSAKGGEIAMRHLLALPLEDRPTAVFCQSDEMAFGALHAIRMAGLNCPDDVSVIGVDDHELSEIFDVTTVFQPVPEQGAAAARWVVEQLQDGESTGEAAEHVNLHPVRLVVRSTTRAL
jgi:DNA-binding LacI/PurR family transcriptional regulator